jgi:cell wall-associated NlpC family hydrolase
MPLHATGGAAISKLVAKPKLKPEKTDHDAIPQLTATPPSTGNSGGLGANPAVGLALSHLSGLFANVQGPPLFLIPIYKQASRRYHVPWPVLAAINSIETDYGRNLSVSSAGAIGWMQFMPDTWRAYGVAADGHGRPNPYNARDAIYSAARYLRANGARHNLRRAIFAYNHATWYVDEVLWRAQTIRDRSTTRVKGPAGRKLTQMIAMADLLNGLPYVWGGGHGGWQLVSGYDCSGFVSAVLHAAGYLSAPQTTATLPAQPGIQAGPGQYVTIFDRTAAGTQGHVIIDLNGTFYESGGSAFGGGGAGVKKIRQPPADYLVTFDRMLHPAGL